MELTVKRDTRTKTSTIGQLFVNDTFFSYTLEDVDRGLTSDMPVETIKSIKVPKQTCVPTGRYKLSKYKSPKHNNAEVILVNGVPGFDFIEIHAGNTSEDTDGCLLPGFSKGVDFVGNSRDAVQKLYSIVFAAIEAGEDAFITYE